MSKRIELTPSEKKFKKRIENDKTFKRFISIFERQQNPQGTNKDLNLM